jgi:imidazole glycerol-phosphate synthase subunit HisH
LITIVDYKAGNLTSVKLAFEYINADVEITDKPEKVLAASKVVFPGVGAAQAAMADLKELGLFDAVKKVVADGIPFLGICIGMQLLFDFSEENNGTDCIGIIPGKVKKFQPSNQLDKIPQMGWNAVKQVKPHKLFDGIEDQSEFYFVHSYYPSPDDSSYTFGQTDYADVTFTSAAGRDNFFATQFHPERSGRIGLKLLENFCRWDGKC